MLRTGKKITGGRYHAFRKKKKREMQNQARIVKLGEIKKKKLRTRGGNYKTVLFLSNVANIIKNKKCKQVKIKNVLETPNNRFLARQNILVKGAIIETEEGKARITNRPSQEGCVQAVLIDEKA